MTPNKLCVTSIVIPMFFSLVVSYVNLFTTVFIYGHFDSDVSSITCTGARGFQRRVRKGRKEQEP